jgi:hypothetical protein
VIIPLLRSINIASIRLSNDDDSKTDTVPHAATAEHETLLGTLLGSFTARSKQSDVEFDVQSSKTHIVIARWQAGISDLHRCDNQTVVKSRFRAYSLPENMPLKYDNTVDHNSRNDAMSMSTGHADSGLILEISSLNEYLYDGAQDELHKKSRFNIAQRSSIINARQSFEQ